MVFLRTSGALSTELHHCMDAHRQDAFLLIFILSHDFSNDWRRTWWYGLAGSSAPLLGHADLFVYLSFRGYDGKGQGMFGSHRSRRVEKRNSLKGDVVIIL